MGGGDYDEKSSKIRNYVGNNFGIGSNDFRGKVEIKAPEGRIRYVVPVGGSIPPPPPPPPDAEIQNYVGNNFGLAGFEFGEPFTIRSVSVHGSHGDNSYEPSPLAPAPASESLLAQPVSPLTDLENHGPARAPVPVLTPQPASPSPPGSRAPAFAPAPVLAPDRQNMNPISSLRSLAPPFIPAPATASQSMNRIALAPAPQNLNPISPLESPAPAFAAAPAPAPATAFQSVNRISPIESRAPAFLPAIAPALLPAIAPAPAPQPVSPLEIHAPAYAPARPAGPVSPLVTHPPWGNNNGGHAPGPSTFTTPGGRIGTSCPVCGSHWAHGNSMSNYQ